MGFASLYPPYRSLSYAPQSSGSETPSLDHGVTAEKPFAISLDRRQQSYSLQRGIFTTDAQQHDARRCTLPPKDKIAEVFVFSKEQPRLTRREVDNFRVAQTRSSFGNVSYVVTGRA